MCSIALVMVIDIESIQIKRNGIGCPTCGCELKKVEKIALVVRFMDKLCYGKQPVRYNCIACSTKAVII